MATTADRTTEILELHRAARGCSPAEGATEEIVNPATGDVIATAPLSGEADVDAAVKAAGRAFPEWSETPPGERALALLKIADALEGAERRAGDLESLNVGKLSEATGGVAPVVVDTLRFFAGARALPQGTSARRVPAGIDVDVRREPIGVVGQIAPWNYPLIMADLEDRPRARRGEHRRPKARRPNPDHHLHLPSSPRSTFPKGVLNVIAGHGEPAGAALVTAPRRRDGLSDRLVRDRKGSPRPPPTAKRIHFELGGKAPVVVFDDADIETAIETIAGTGYYNAGQDCTAATRVLAGRASTTTSSPGSRSRPRGSWSATRCRRGHHARAAQLRSASASASRASSSARPTTPRSSPAAREPDLPGFFLEPTVVAGLEQDDEMIQREIFGPVITVQRFLRRGGGDRHGKRRRLRARRQGLDARLRARHERSRATAAQVRNGVGERPHPARVRDAARGLRAVRVRQGPVDLRARGLQRRPST